MSDTTHDTHELNEGDEYLVTEDWNGFDGSGRTDMAVQICDIYGDTDTFVALSAHGRPFEVSIPVEQFTDALANGTVKECEDSSERISGDDTWRLGA